MTSMEASVRGFDWGRIESVMSTNLFDSGQKKLGSALIRRPISGIKNPENLSIRSEQRIQVFGPSNRDKFRF